MIEKVKDRPIQSWFEPVGRPVFKGPLKLSKILLKDPKRIKKNTPVVRKLVLSVSAASGNAVKRNSFRRLVREFFKSNWPGQLDPREGIWLVLNRRFNLETEQKDWKKILTSALSEVL